MLGEDIDLDVDAVTASARAQGCHRQRVGDQHDGKPVIPTSTRVRLMPSTAIDPFATISSVQLGSISNSRNSHSPCRRRSRKVGGGVDVALDKMSAKSVAHLERPFEVDSAARLPVVQVRALECFRSGLDHEFFAGRCDDGEAAAVDRHAFAEFQGIETRQALPDESSIVAPPLVLNILDAVPGIQPIP